MSVEINAREVLKYLNELGYCDISTGQLKEFIRDLKTLIKYDHKKKSHRENQENIQPVSSESNYYSIHHPNELTPSEYESGTEEIETQTRDENYLSDIFNHLHCTSTVSSRAKSCSKKPSDQNIISVEILKPKPSRPISSSRTTSSKYGLHKEPSSTTLTRTKTKYTITSSDTASETPQFTGSSRTGRRIKSCDNLGNEFRPKVSFIRPRKPLKVSKTDPVALYQQYQEEWKKQKLPGEDKRYDLRWAIRERMLGEPDVVPRTSMETISRKGSRI